MSIFFILERSLGYGGLFSKTQARDFVKLDEIVCSVVNSRPGLEMKLQIVALLAAITLLIVGCASSVDGETTPQRIRVMTYNIHHGEGADGKIDTTRIAELIRKENVDIVGLQEIDRGVARSARRDLIAELASETGMHFCFGKNIVYQGGDYGNAVLSRFPIVSQSNTHFRMLHPHEQRGIQELMLDVHGTKLLLMNTHIDYRPEDQERRINVKEMRRLIARQDKLPIILTGDFNSTPESEVCAEIREFMNDTWAAVGQGNGFSLSSTQPEKRIDYIWFSKNDRVVPQKVWVPQTRASDHLPVVAEFIVR